MKLYTKSGDDGTTGLVTGQRIKKDTPRVEACGGVDELNSAVGLAVAACRDIQLKAVLATVQKRLFEVGADLMTPQDQVGQAAGAVVRLGPDRITEAERAIDTISQQLPPVAHFILPGGSELAARLHTARTACRLAERRVVALSHHEPVNRHVVVYLNRLSDLMFAMARRANQLEGVPDVAWEGGKREGT